MIKTYWLSMILLAVIAQVGTSCTHAPDRSSMTEEDREVAKKRVPFNYHKHFNDRN